MCPDVIKPYWNVRQELSENGGILYRGEQIVIPYGYQKQALASLHTGHLGLVKCMERAKTTLYWPGYLRGIEDAIERCSACQQMRNAQAHEPLITTPVPKYPFQKVGADLFVLDGVNYLLTVDYYSKWITIARLRETESEDVITELKRTFTDFGTPEVFISDNGPQFGSVEFRRFMTESKVTHTTSSPRYARGNGEAERMVHVANNLMHKCQLDGSDYQKGLAALRDTPISNKIPSPSELLQGRRLRGNLPVVSVDKRFPRTYNRQRVKDAFDERTNIGKQYHDRKAGPTRETASAGDRVRVRIQDEWVPATVVRPSIHPRSFVVRTTRGSEFRRNHCDVRLTREPPPEVPPPSRDIEVHPEHESDVATEPEASAPGVESVPPVESISPYVTRSGRCCRSPARLDI